MASSPGPAPVGTRIAPPQWRRVRRHSWGWWALRFVLTALVMAVLYVAVTFSQVYRASNRDGARPADAIVVLGAAQYGGRPSPVLQERLDHALELYEADVAPVVVLTGGKQAGDTATEASTGFVYLRQQGVPEDALKLENQGSSTWESLQAVRAVVLADDQDEIVLVTDDYHAYRVEAIAEEVGFDATVSPSDSLRSGSNQLRQLLRETAAVSVGRIIGYDRLFRIDLVVND